MESAAVVVSNGTWAFVAVAGCAGIVVAGFVELVALKRMDCTTCTATYEEYLIAADLRPESKRVYRVHLKKFCEWCELHGIDVCDTDKDIIEMHLLETCINPFTIASVRTAIKGWLHYTEREKMREYGLAQTLTNKVELSQSKRRPMRLPDVHCLLDSIDYGRANGRRDYLLCLLGVVCGMRTIEMSRLDIGDIATRDGIDILWVQGKGEDTKNKYVVLPEIVLNAILIYLSGRKSGPILLSQKGGRMTPSAIQRAIKIALQNAGLGQYSAHSLRHTAATLARGAGVDIADVGMMLRHTNVHLTMHYSKDAHHRDLSNAAERVIARLVTR